MIHRVPDAQPYRVRTVSIEEIITIEDASLCAREHTADIPRELLRCVWEVRGELSRGRLRQLANRYPIRRQWKLNTRTVHESDDWILYEVRRHAVAELESLLGAGVGLPAHSSNAGSGAVGESVLAQGAAPWRLAKTPRNMEAFVESLCQVESRFLVPFGEDFETAPLGTRISAGECYRRLVCFRFDVPYETLPLGAKKLQAFVQEACRRERTAPEEGGAWSAQDLAETLQRSSEAHVWLQLLLTRTGVSIVSVDWSERAEQFTSFLQATVLQSLLLAETFKQMKRGQLRVLALWWTYLSSSKAASIRRPSLMTTLVLGKKSYVPVEAVMAPERPYFTTVPLLGLPKISAPRVCQLCGAGFRDWKGLVGHCDREHGGFNEYRTTLFWEADKCHALGLPSVRKRNMVANATTAMLYSSAGAGSELEERRQEACAVCARKDWLEARFQCHLWKPFPGGDAGELAEEEEAEEDGTGAELSETSDDEGRRRPRRWALRDVDGVYYVGDAAKVHQHLGVEHYAKAMPLIPVEELHASSVQHPRFPAYRWLLHTRRVPTRPQETGGASHPAGIAESAAARGRGREDGGDGAAEPVSEPGPDGSSLPRCAGVGVEESTVWICRQCRDALCVRDGIYMPSPALANLMWGGREHPAYQDISEATSVLLGRGRLVYQQISLKKGAPDVQPVGLSGNCILLTQPKSSEIIQTLPPPSANLTDNFVVLFTTGRQDVRNAKNAGGTAGAVFALCTSAHGGVRSLRRCHRVGDGGAREPAGAGRARGFRRRSAGSARSRAFQADHARSRYYANSGRRCGRGGGGASGGAGGGNGRDRRTVRWHARRCR